MNITNAKYITNEDGDNETIKCHIDGMSVYVPMVENNRHYIEIMRQVSDENLTIAEPDV